MSELGRLRRVGPFLANILCKDTQTHQIPDVTDQVSWPFQNAWLAKKLDHLHAVFYARVRRLETGLGD